MSALTDLCEKHDVKVTYNGIHVEPASRKRFTVTLTMGDKAWPEQIAYRMGVPEKPWRSLQGSAEQERAYARECAKRIPTVDDVLYSLLSDASCYDSARDFKDFCAELGYSDDSIKARDTYAACGETSVRCDVQEGPMKSSPLAVDIPARVRDLGAFIAEKGLDDDLAKWAQEKADEENGG